MAHRRSFLKKSGQALPILVGVSSSMGCANAQRSELPIQWAKSRKAPIESSGLTGSEEHKDIKSNKVTANSSGHSEFELEAFFSGNGTLGMSGATTYGSRWQAPETGEYTLTATYWGYGGYEPAISDPWELDIDTSASAEVNLAVLDSSESVVNERTISNFGAGTRGMSEEVMEFLIEFLATRLVRAYFGVIGSLIARFLLNSLEIDLGFLTGNDFWIDPLEGHQLELPFAAEKGETYDLNFTPCVGFSVESREGPYPPFVPAINAYYTLKSLQIQYGDGGVSF